MERGTCDDDVCMWIVRRAQLSCRELELVQPLFTRPPRVVWTVVTVQLAPVTVRRVPVVASLTKSNRPTPRPPSVVALP